MSSNAILLDESAPQCTAYSMQPVFCMKFRNNFMNKCTHCMYTDFHFQGDISVLKTI